MKHLCLFILFISLLSPGAAQVITTFAGTGVSGFSGEGGPAINAQFDFLAGITSDKWGNTYIADFYNNVIQKIDSHGTLSRFAGSGAVGDGGDGGPATNASLDLYVVVGLVVDTLGNLYISDGGKIRKVSTSGIISTFVGTGAYGASGDGGLATAASLKAPVGLCFDKEGNLYIADEQASNIRKVNPFGVISTYAGTSNGFSGDGGAATNAQLSHPEGLATDSVGNLYIADGGNFRIRMIDTSGIITSIAGGGGSLSYVACYGFPASNLQLNGPVGVAADNKGNVYVSAIANDVVHKISPDANAYTIAGIGEPGFSGDGGPGTAAKINSPTMISVDKYGNILIADKGNDRIRKVWLGTVYTPTVNLGSSLLYVYPNPTVGKTFTCNAITADTSESAGLIVTDVVGRVVSTMSCTTNTPTPVSLPVPAGMYFITATTRSGKRVSTKIIVD